jgi:hypothetical protein
LRAPMRRPLLYPLWQQLPCRQRHRSPWVIAAKKVKARNPACVYSGLAKRRFRIIGHSSALV